MEENTTQTEQTEIAETPDYQALYNELTTRFNSLEKERDALNQKIIKLTNDLNETHRYILHSGREAKQSRYEELRSDIL